MLYTIFVAASCTPEYAVFIEYYSKILGSLSVSTVCPHLVSEKIISHKEETEILSSVQTEAPRLLLGKIYCKLNAGLTQSFYKLLDILDDHGNIDCQGVIADIRKKLQELKGKCNIKGNNITSGAKF